jgi:transposase
MPTSLLYHAFGVRGYKYARSEYENGQVILTIYEEPATCVCSCCGSNGVISRGRVDRHVRSLPIGCRRAVSAEFLPACQP